MARAKKKRERRVHIDNLHLVKKLDPEYSKLFFDLEDTLFHSGMSDEEINAIANTAIDQLSEGMAKKKKPSLIISPERDFRGWLSKVKHTPAYRQTQSKLLQQDDEKFTISGIWLVFCVSIILFFLKNLITDSFLINFSIDLIAGALALVFAVRNYQTRWRVIRKNKEKRFYLSCDIAVLVLCLITKVTVPGNFDISYLMLVVAYFITNRKLKRYTQQQLEARKS